MNLVASKNCSQAVQAYSNVANTGMFLLMDPAWRKRVQEKKRAACKTAYSQHQEVRNEISLVLNESQKLLDTLYLKGSHSL